MLGGCTCRYTLNAGEMQAGYVFNLCVCVFNRRLLHSRPSPVQDSTVRCAVVECPRCNSSIEPLQPLILCLFQHELSLLRHGVATYTLEPDSGHRGNPSQLASEHIYTRFATAQLRTCVQDRKLLSMKAVSFKVQEALGIQSPQWVTRK